MLNLFLLVETDFLAGGNHFLPWPHIFQGVLHCSEHKTHFAVQKNSIVFYSELFFLLVKTIIEIIEKPIYNPYCCSLIFWILLSMGAVFPSKRNVFLKEFSIPAYGKRRSV